MQNKTISRKIKDLVWSFLGKLNLGGPVELMLTGAMVEDGWFKSHKTKQSVDKDGKPIPWCSYPFIKFIEPRLKKSFEMFEYGSGNSTIWYAQKVKTIKAVEHDKSWFEIIQKKLPSNASVVHRELTGDSYAKEVLKEDKKYNIIVVDGRDRNNCVSQCIHKLTDDGVIVYDNTQFPEYASSIEFLLRNNFKKIDFIGLSPIIAQNNTTTIFYKPNNCLQI